MTITWLGRSCFKITHDGYSIVIDPYSAGSTGYPELHVSADMVLISHDHPGHNNAAAVTLSGTSRPCPFEIEKVEVGHGGSCKHVQLAAAHELGGVGVIHHGLAVAFYSYFKHT